MLLKKGSRGDRVRRLQALLCLSGFDATPIDGAFGSGTARAVGLCQMANGIPQTGQADASTQTAVGMDQPDPTMTPIPVIDRVNVNVVAQMFSPHTPRANIEKYLPEVLHALREAALDDCDIVLMALATIRAETEGFEPIDERPSKFNTDPGAHPFNRYDDRADLGNQGPPDGERYKGRGFIQLTGRANYLEIGMKIGLGTDLVETPERANDATIAAQILANFIKAKERAAKYAILGQDLRTARKLVNGGSHGIDRFTQAFDAGAAQLSSG